MISVVSMVIGLLSVGSEPLPAVVEFNRDIRPILSDHCYQCHGPDERQRRAGLRLDTAAEALAPRGGRPALVAGWPERSELYRRITAADPSERMPPASTGRNLNERQMALLRRWIEQGATYQAHWSFLPPRRPSPPPVRDPRWPRNPIDTFILARLEQEGLTPAPEADRPTLLRRVTLDLTGLPPTPDEIAVALADSSPDWYEKQVDRLLASPRFGERLALRWLEAARYADTNGYQTDGERTMWRWRDWVIDACNRNLPFDQFTIEQLAGDLLPNPTLEQRIATGFNRNHRGNSEGGIIPEEFAVEYVADRVETTGTVWLGLTLTCARCHDHKYDPLTQKDYYQLFAFFNNVPERGKAVKFGNSPPYILSPTPAQQEELARLDAQLQSVADELTRREAEIAARQREWEKSLAKAGSIDWSVRRGLLLHEPLAGPTQGRFVDGPPASVAGPRGPATNFDGRCFLDLGDVAEFGFYDKFTLSAWVKPASLERGTILSRMTDTARAEGYAVQLKAGKLQVNLVKRWLDDAIRLETVTALVPDRWQHVCVSYDGSRLARGVRVYVDGQPAEVRVLLDDLNQSFHSSEPFRVGSDGGTEHRFRGAIAEVRVYNQALSAEEVRTLATLESVEEIGHIAPERRSLGQQLALRFCFLERAAPEPIRTLAARRVELEEKRQRFVESLPTTMVMEELPTPRDTFILVRGVYDRPGAKVVADVPACLPPLSRRGAVNRLDLARWLVQPDHPLTARVAVNRMWQLHFGTGIVKTVDDFGSQGDWPSHPELLDWLATEFIRLGWDVKALHRLIVTSATYRQSSKATPALLQKDPENRLLARGPRYRLSADMVRDQALAVSGLLVERLGGPSVKPYQPAGLWRELTGGVDYQADRGPNLYRRSLYTFWKRTAPPPMMTTFDAANRETCTVRESRTNTPLQALNLMNDVTFVEAARALAERVMSESGPGPAERLSRAFLRATARVPTEAERRILVEGWRYHRQRYEQDRIAAAQLVGVGDSRPNPQLDVVELAAYTAMTSVILNLDETLTKE
ncbi:MAG: DUF1553 domain-containing protein [Gemmataceae bacterium]|nr:DUF1553 domain-containing protein [Gemmataceae bacterium]MDW8266285.1 DUF1553 domain-containing protein [Gemmataceae bacterium]